MINKPLDQITKEDIEALVENEQTENAHIEYKEILPDLKNDQEIRKKFLRLVSSFANKAGGRIIYGIKEGQDSDSSSGVPVKAIGIKDFNEDQAKLKLQESIRNGISPIISGIDFKKVEGFEEGPVFIVQINKSWSAPHIINPEDKKTGFYIRANNQTIPMDYNEIRTAFLQSEIIEEKTKKFRDGRMQIIKEGGSLITNLGSPLVILHLIPLSFLNPEMRIDLPRAIFSEAYRSLGTFCNDFRYNADGLLIYSNESPAYLQFFNSGVIEAASSRIILETGGEKIIHSVGYEKTLIDSTKSYLNFFLTRGVSPPAVIFISLLNVNGVHFEGNQRNPIERNDVLIPEILIQDFSQEPSKVLRPLFNMVCQACGYEKSFNYDDDGDWIGDQR
jgi:Schlafen, AlbA_2